MTETNRRPLLRLYPVLPLAFFLLVNLLFINRYFPPTEGWWVTFGDLVNKGWRPYEDFNLQLPPLFVFLNAAILRYVGRNLLAIRFLGLLLAGVTVLLLQVFLKRFFPRRVAATGTLLASFLWMDNPVYIVNDYHILLDFFVILSLIFSTNIASAINQEKVGPKTRVSRTTIHALMLGATVALICLIKQNVGIFLLVVYALILAFVYRDSCTTCFRNLLFYFCGCALVGTLFLTQLSDSAVLSHLLVKNDAKGSPLLVLTRFATDPLNRNAIGAALAVLVACFWAKRFLADSRATLAWFQKPLDRGAVKESTMFLLNGLLLTVSLSVALGLPLFFRTYFVFIIPTSISVLFALLLETWNTKSSQDRITKWTYLLPLSTLAYCNTHTASFNFEGLFFVIAFASCHILDRILRLSLVRPIYLYLLFLCPLLPITISKLAKPYSWWGLEQQSILEATYTLPYPETQGFYVDEPTWRLFTKIKHAIEAYSKSKRDVYLFPHIPIFYYLHDKVPPFRNVVQWFDVISSQEAAAELARLRESPPRVIITLQLPRFVYAGHESLLGRRAIQREFEQSFDCLQTRLGYFLVEDFIYAPERDREENHNFLGQANQCDSCSKSQYVLKIYARK